MTETTTQTINKLNRILEGLMNCRLEFQPVTELAPEDWNSKDLGLMKVGEENAPPFIEGESTGSFGFPVNVHGSFAGLAVVRGWQGARSQQLMQLAELLTQVLESSIVREERGESLRQLEERLRLLESQASNVVQLHSARPREPLSIVDIPETPEPINSPITSTPLLIETKPGFPLQRIAIEVHQMSQRWAFLALESLSPDVLESREGLKELGGVTIFIEDLSKLSEQQQLRLAEYLSTKPGQELPQVIAGLTESSAKLRSDGRLLPRLVDLFCVSELNWSDKTGAEVTRDLIEASLRFILEKTRESVMVPNEPLRFLPFNVRALSDDNPTVH